jgi:hypothetical protein
MISARVCLLAVLDMNGLRGVMGMETHRSALPHTAESLLLAWAVRSAEFRHDLVAVKRSDKQMPCKFVGLAGERLQLRRFGQARIHPQALPNAASNPVRKLVDGGPDVCRNGK